MAELVAKATPGKMAAASSSDSDSGRAERLSPGSSPLPFPQMNRWCLVAGSGLLLSSSGGSSGRAL